MRVLRSGIVVILSVVAIAATGCKGEKGDPGANGNDGTNGTAGRNSLVRTTTEPAGTNCTHGGFKVEVGVDTSGDGQLQAGEVTATSYACNGAPGSGTNGQTALVVTTTEPAGSNCAFGGTKIQTGLDANNNGQLDPGAPPAGEVQSTTFACNGSPGPVTRSAEACVVCHGLGQLADEPALHAILKNNSLSRNVAAITSVTIPNSATTGGAPTVVFTVRDSATSAPVAGLTAFNFTVARLVTDAASGYTNWQSYLNRNYNNSNTALPISVGGTTVSSTATSNPRAVCTEAPAGTYTCVLSTDLSQTVTLSATSSSAQVTVPYDNTAILRVGMQSGAPIPGGTVTTVPATPPFNAVYDLDPQTGAGVAEQRVVVLTSSCNACHQRLTVHGRRLDVNYCVTCHNPSSFDPASGTTPETLATVDMKWMAHKLHMGKNLANGYVLVGNDFSHIGYPQDPGNCLSCHGGTGVGDNWKARPSIEACGACHDTISFVDPPPTGRTLHTGGAAVNADCSGCHQAGRAGRGADVVHKLPATVPFAYNIVSVTGTSPGSSPVVTFTVKNPTTNTDYDLATDPAWTDVTAGASRLALSVGWNNGNANYVNTGGPSPGQPLNLDVLRGLAATPPTVVRNLDGSYTATFAAVIPASATGSGIVALDGHPADRSVTPLGRIPVKNATKTFAVTDTTAKSRRLVVSIDKCNVCHQNLSLHGNNRTGSIETCVLCHNTEATDANRRPTSGTLDGKAEESVDFKRMIHGIHGATIFASLGGKGPVIYGFGGAANDFRDFGYPGYLTNCEACHVRVANTGLVSATGTPTWAEPYPALNSAGLAAFMDPTKMNGTASSTGPAATRGNQAAYLRITKITATCSGCHSAPIFEAHMQQMGGQFGATQAEIDALNQ